MCTVTYETYVTTDLLISLARGIQPFQQLYVSPSVDVVSLSAVQATVWVNACFHGHQVQIFPPQSRIWLQQKKPDLSTWHFVPVFSFREHSLVLTDSLLNTGAHETRDPPSTHLQKEIYTISFSLFVNYYCFRVTGTMDTALWDLLTSVLGILQNSNLKLVF